MTPDRFDRYDWHPEEGFAVEIPVYGVVTDGAMDKLINAGAKPYNVYMGFTNQVKIALPVKRR